MRVSPDNRLSAWRLVLATCLLAAGPAARAAEVLDVVAIRNAAGPSVCLVTPLNEYGIPLARASGFLFGKGGFVVTDLGTLARRGAVRAAVQFPDGTSAVATRFGMADPLLGVAVIRLDKGASEPDGLALAAKTPALDEGLPIVRLGWRWGKELAVVTGRLVKGPTTDELPDLLGFPPPAGAPAFLNVESPRLDGAAHPSSTRTASSPASASTSSARKAP